MNEVILSCSQLGAPVHCAKSPWGPMLITSTPEKFYGWFKSATHTTTATTIMATPEDGGSLSISDIVISAEKITAGTATVRFYDGTNEEVIAEFILNDGPCNFSWSPKGRVWGWQDAYIDFATPTANTDATCTICYQKVEPELTMGYNEWDGAR